MGGAITVAMVMAVSTTMAAPVSMGGGGRAHGQCGGDKQGGNLFHGSARRCRLDKPNNAPGEKAMTAAKYSSVRNCYRSTGRHAL